MTTKDGIAEEIAIKVVSRLKANNEAQINTYRIANNQLKKEKRYYVASLSLMCFVLAGMLYWNVEIREPEHNFNCEIVVTPKEDNSWL